MAEHAGQRANGIRDLLLGVRREAENQARPASFASRLVSRSLMPTTTAEDTRLMTLPFDQSHRVDILMIRTSPAGASS